MNGAFAARADARGTLLLAGGSVFARNQTGGSYALVRTGHVGGIPITRENVEVGTTDRNGLLLVQNIPAQATIKIDVKADKLPVDALVRETTKYIRVPQRAVALVEIETLRFRPILRKLVDQAGQPLTAGLPVRALPSGETTMVGFDGVAEINAGARDTRLLVGRDGPDVRGRTDRRAACGWRSGCAALPALHHRRGRRRRGRRRPCQLWPNRLEGAARPQAPPPTRFDGA